MEQDLGTEIIRFREMLEREPNSYCFAPLADLYRKSGLLDDAIAVARRGCEIHPDYVGGFLALGRACREKGLNDESRAALEKVMAITPDNLLAQKLLSRIYIDQGDKRTAEKSLRSVLAQSPDDLETRALLDSLMKESAGQTASEEGEFELLDDDDGILEDLEIIEELSDEDLLDFDVETLSPEEEESVSGFSGPMLTVTMAELYLSQGFVSKALAIYREMLAADPGNADLQRRILDAAAIIEKDAVGETGAPAVRSGEPSLWIPPGPVPKREVLAASGADRDTVVETLEQWLEAIKRRR